MFSTDVNFLAVLVAAVAYFIIGGLWYSVLFGKAWLAAIGKTEEEVRSEGGAPVAYVVSFISSLISAYFLAIFMNGTTLQAGLAMGLWVWMGFVATTNSPPYFYENRNKKLYLIYGAYTLVSFLVMGAILALWQ